MQKITAFRRGTFFVLLLAASCAFADEFHWNWRDWQELSPKQTLRVANLNQKDRAAIASAIMLQLQASGIVDDIPRNQTTDPLDTRVKTIDLNQGAVAEIAAQSSVGCSPTGNCPFWIFQKTSLGYSLVLDGFGQTFTVQKNRTNGFNDIVVSMHGGTFINTLEEFTYGDGRYHETGCYDAAWTTVDGDNVRELKEPIITPCEERKHDDVDSSTTALNF